MVVLVYIPAIIEGCCRRLAYDVPSTLEVISTENYNFLPKCIEDIGKQTVPAKEEQELPLPKMNTLLQ